MMINNSQRDSSQKHMNLGVIAYKNSINAYIYIYIIYIYKLLS